MENAVLNKDTKAYLHGDKGIAAEDEIVTHW
jgi:hypothetical protein